MVPPLTVGRRFTLVIHGVTLLLDIRNVVLIEKTTGGRDRVVGEGLDRRFIGTQ